MTEDDDATSNKVVWQIEDRICELGTASWPQDAGSGDPARGLGQGTLKKTDLACAVAADGRFPVKVVAETLGVARSNLIDRLKGKTKPRRPYHKAQDGELVPRITTLVTARPTYGDRRITGILNRQLRSEDLAPVNHKRVYRIMQAQSLLLARKHKKRPKYVHDGKVIVMRSNLGWCSDGFEFTCWNSDIVRGAFIIDAHDREIIAWRAVVNTGISGSDIRDIMLKAVERRFGTYRAPSVIEILTDNGSPYIAKDTQIFARQFGLKPCFTPVRSPQRCAARMSEAFVTTLKRDCVQVPPLPDAQTVLGLIGGWTEDDNDNHPQSGLKMRSPREFIATQTVTA